MSLTNLGPEPSKPLFIQSLMLAKNSWINCLTKALTIGSMIHSLTQEPKVLPAVLDELLATDFSLTEIDNTDRTPKMILLMYLEMMPAMQLLWASAFLGTIKTPPGKTTIATIATRIIPVVIF